MIVRRVAPPASGDVGYPVSFHVQAGILLRVSMSKRGLDCSDRADPAQDAGRRYPRGVRRPERNREILSAFLLGAACAFGYIPWIVHG